MRWSPEQDRCLVETAAWLADPGAPQVRRVFGYAGTGKTSLANELAASVTGEVLFGAYTGKAAYVLRQKGGRAAGASTIHSLIYRSKEKSRARLRELEQAILELRAELRSQVDPEEPLPFSRKLCELEADLEEEKGQAARPFFDLNPESPVKDAALLVLDECSMIDGQMGEDILSFGTKVLVLGDPAQLPPVMGGGFFTEGRPDTMLTEIHRQAADNPIIRLATIIREGGHLQPGKYGESTVWAQGTRLDPEYVMDADQLLVGRNATRRASNARARQLLGHGDQPLPVVGDRLVCLRNNHELGLLNGAMFTAAGCLDTGDMKCALTVQPEGDGRPLDVEAHTHYFLGRESDLQWYEKKEAQEFDYGYALTCHKAQGSQWNRVTVFDESWCFKADRYKWLYTAVTRAAERVDVVKM